MSNPGDHLVILCAPSLTLPPSLGFVLGLLTWSQARVMNG